MIISTINLKDDPAGTQQPELADQVRTLNRFGALTIAESPLNNDLSWIRALGHQADIRLQPGRVDSKRDGELLRAGVRALILDSTVEPNLLRKLPADKIQIFLGSIHPQRSRWIRQSREMAHLCGSYLLTMDPADRIDSEDLAELRALPHPFTLSVANLDQARNLSKEMDVQLDFAVTTSDLTALLVDSLDFSKNDLLPTIVQEADGQILMLAYTSPKSLNMALQTGRGVYFSRSRQEIWIKGDSSGNTQELLSCRVDCDRDTLLFTVKQKGPACHTGHYSCFGDRRFSLPALYQLLEQRKRDLPAESYTARLFKDPQLLRDKIKEEADEVISAPDRRNLVWEIADLTYFLAVEAVRQGISWNEITAELDGRTGGR